MKGRRLCLEHTIDIINLSPVTIIEKLMNQTECEALTCKAMAIYYVRFLPGRRYKDNQVSTR
jgi:hypothetical protein